MTGPSTDAEPPAETREMTAPITGVGRGLGGSTALHSTPRATVVSVGVLLMHVVAWATGAGTPTTLAGRGAVEAIDHR